MDIIKYILISVLVLTELLIIFFAIRSRKFFRTLLLNAILGIIAIVIINLTKKYSGVYIPINYDTLGAGSILSIPGVIGILICNFIFI